VLDVVQAVDPLKRIDVCPLGISAHGTVLCPLHRKLDDAIRHVAEAFGTTTLAALVGPRHRLRPLCAR
jgi:Rrf2 family nitric oxide-sensitive transcriptional repressor